MKPIEVKISEEVKNILKQGTVDENLYFLPQVQLSRDEYMSVNKILELLGGKWSRSKKAHVFDNTETANSVISSLEYESVVDKKKTYQFFETPREVVLKMVELADIKKGMSILEPSAGHGAILSELPKDIELHLIEVDKEKCKVLECKGYTSVDCVDFLTLKNDFGGFDRVIMNPPFTKGQDAEHILHAFSLLKEGGVLVSIASASVTFNSQKKYQKLRDIIESYGYLEELPEETFKESGTSVRTVIIKLKK